MNRYETENETVNETESETKSETKATSRTQDPCIRAAIEAYNAMDFDKAVHSMNINHPMHYTQGKIECIDAIAAAVTGLSGIEAVLVGNIIKYVWRYRHKNGVEDLKKAQWYLDRLVEEVSGNGRD